jgi:quercetin dioxygenase-like cupin family protein
VKPGDTLARHFHHGEEAVYVLESATLILPDGKEIPFPVGTAVINKRDQPHAGFKVGGKSTLINRLLGPPDPLDLAQRISRSRCISSIRVKPLLEPAN